MRTLCAFLAVVCMPTNLCADVAKKDFHLKDGTFVVTLDFTNLGGNLKHTEDVTLASKDGKRIATVQGFLQVEVAITGNFVKADLNNANDSLTFQGVLKANNEITGAFVGVVKGKVVVGSFTATPKEADKKGDGKALKPEQRIGRMSQDALPHPIVHEKQRYFDIVDGGKTTRQILVVFAKGLKQPEEGKLIRLEGRAERIDLGGPRGTKREYRNELFRVSRWEYCTEQPPKARPRD